MLYSASEIEVLNETELHLHPLLGKLGPDLLDQGLDARAVRRRLEDRRFGRRSLGALYLDQAFLAGLGNYLRSEILFAAGLHPALRPCELEHGQAQVLARQTLAIARRSYRTGGVTLTASARPARRAPTIAGPSSRPESDLLPRGRRGRRAACLRRAVIPS